MGIDRWLRTALLTLALGSAVIAEPRVEMPGSKVTYHGETRHGVEDFHGIKYAHDTSGPRRFAPPEPYEPTEGSDVDATVPGAACPQIRAAVPPFFSETEDQSEDCLSLRITRPAGTRAGDRLPVIAHIPGGGLVKAWSEDALHDPAGLVLRSVAAGRPVVHVFINFRVTVFGFARLPLLRERGSLNAGLRDQRLAFEWIRDHIAAFGGDAARVTALGLSAGGTMASTHLMAYGGERGVPFTRLWAMSGPPGTSLNMTTDATEIHTRSVAGKLGCGGGGGSGSDEELLECLRAVPMDELTTAATAHATENHPPLGLFTFIPSVDGDFLPERPSVLYRGGRSARGVPAVLGWTQDDGATNAGPALAFATEADMKTPIRGFAHALADDDYARLFALYPAADFEADAANYEAARREREQDDDDDAAAAPPPPPVPVHYFRVARILRDLLFTCSAVDFGRELSRQSRALDAAFAGVRLYALNQSTVAPVLRAAGMPWLGGAVHGSDMDYLYANMSPRDVMSEADRRVSDHLVGALLNFAYDGRPGGGDAEAWPEAFAERGAALGASFGDAGETGPSGINIQVIGGPFGTGTGRVRSTASGIMDFPEHADTMQVPLDESVSFKAMESPGSEERHALLQRERLLERCRFIDSLSEKLGN
ncbi:alpha/beta-hydrolase [Xylariaceae sp. FL0804]|nr:alpha/beta-hydrolase [Xylariaceae sp. FL0804]